MNTLQKHAYVLNVMSNDHPGIVAAVGHAVTEQGGNIDAVSQTVLEGHFTLIMIISFAEPVEPSDLADRISQAGAGYQVLCRRYEPPAAEPQTGETEQFVVTAFGQDKPGIILRFSQYLAGKDVNILDLYGDRDGDQFVLIGQVEIPASQEIRNLQVDLEEMGREVGFTVRLQHENIFVATNQLRLGLESRSNA